jgi:hypothetical protein
MQVADRCVVGPIEKDQQGDKQADQQITHRDLQIFAALSPGSPDSANTPHLSDVAPPAPPSASKPTINKPFFLEYQLAYSLRTHKISCFGQNFSNIRNINHE